MTTAAAHLASIEQMIWDAKIWHENNGTPKSEAQKNFAIKYKVGVYNLAFYNEKTLRFLDFIFNDRNLDVPKLLMVFRYEISDNLRAVFGISSIDVNYHTSDNSYKRMAIAANFTTDYLDIEYMNYLKSFLR